MLIIEYLIPFIIILSFIVFIHELGHYYTAKKFGVKIEEFAIGFGKEIWGFNDKSGTRWKFCIMPLGGYVKMFGDQNIASQPEQEKKFTKKEKEDSFIFKKLYQKFLIVFAGPFANYLLAMFILFFLFAIYGISYSSNKITEVVLDSPASKAGLLANDRILEIDGAKINNFNDIQKIIQINPGIDTKLMIERNNEIIEKIITPKIISKQDFLGNETKYAILGIKSDKVEYKELSIAEAAQKTFSETLSLTILSIKVLKQIILGQRDISDLSGPIKIAKYSGQITKKSLLKDENGQQNLYLIFWFIAIISINLGFINLLPIPILDGGHLMFYIIEALRGKAVPIKIQEVIYKISLIFLVILFIIVSYNDIISLF